jgi:hypothetical protein
LNHGVIIMAYDNDGNGSEGGVVGKSLSRAQLDAAQAKHQLALSAGVILTLGGAAAAAFETSPFWVVLSALLLGAALTIVSMMVPNWKSAIRRPSDSIAKASSVKAALLSSLISVLGFALALYWIGDQLSWSLSQAALIFAFVAIMAFSVVQFVGGIALHRSSRPSRNESLSH